MEGYGWCRAVGVIPGSEDSIRVRSRSNDCRGGTVRRTGGWLSPVPRRPIREAARLGPIRAVRPAAPGLPGRPVHGRAPPRPPALWGDLLRPNVRYHRGLPPLLRPPLVQDEPAVPVPLGLPGLQRHAEGAAVVGRPPPAAPPPLRHRRGPAL